MCGIAGLLTDSANLDVEPAVIARAMAERLRHRGPDDGGTFSDADAGIGLGSRRLAILDLSTLGAQPLHSENGRYVVAYNGEIYNYRELQEELRSAGWSFRGGSDTEVLANAVERWGVSGSLRRCRGMFAVGIWDREVRTLFLARDRLGIKPLHVYHRPDLVAFGSELKAFAGLPQFDAALDRRALASYLRHLYVPAPRSIYRHVSKLPPGHILEVQRPLNGLPEPRPYWSLDDVARKGREEEFQGGFEAAAGELDRRLEDAISIRRRSDVAVGALLSGGLDSTTVVAYLQSLTDTPVRTYTVGFEHDEHDESSHARAVASHLGTDHSELTVSGDRALDVIPALPRIFDEPFADPSLIPTFLISELASREVTVALSGDGGDEVFGGYNRYAYGDPLMRRLARVPGWARRPVGGLADGLSVKKWNSIHEALSRVSPTEMPRLAGEKTKKLARLLMQPDVERMYRSILSAWDDPSRLLRRGQEPEDAIGRAFGLPADLTLLQRMLLADQAQYLPDDLLAKVDRASMANSLEVRVPLLDQRILEFAWRLPDSTKVDGTQTKRILRRVLYDKVPRELVDRPKVGFSVPLAQWLQGPLSEWAGDLLSPDRLRRQGIFRPDPVQQALEGVRSGHTDKALQVWTVLSFQNWYDRQPVRPSEDELGSAASESPPSASDTHRSIRR